MGATITKPPLRGKGIHVVVEIQSDCIHLTSYIYLMQTDTKVTAMYEDSIILIDGIDTKFTSITANCVSHGVYMVTTNLGDRFTIRVNNMMRLSSTNMGKLMELNTTPPRYAELKGAPGLSKTPATPTLV